MAHWPSFDESDASSRNVAAPHSKRNPEKPLASPVPAVERTIAILRLLENSSDPASCTVSGISRALGMNKSTCSNTLRTLESHGFIEYDTTSRTYWLGAGLIGLSVKARHRTFPSVGATHMQALVRKTGFTCVAFEQLPNGEFVIVDKVDSQKDIKITIDVGQHFPPAAPVFARIALAWSSPAEVESFIAQNNLQRFTRTTKTDPDGLRADLRQIRRDGYSISVGEYYLANTAIAAPVFSAPGKVEATMCLVVPIDTSEERTGELLALLRERAARLSIS